ncbi:hypothetical protein D0U88_08685, partial [Salmonella enterica]|nr:hypothetical protein [Salmonella enterica]
PLAHIALPYNKSPIMPIVTQKIRTIPTNYAMPYLIFTPAAHTVVVKRLMHSVDKIHHIIGSKMNGPAIIMSLFWKRTYENRRPLG